MDLPRFQSRQTAPSFKRYPGPKPPTQGRKSGLRTHQPHPSAITGHPKKEISIVISTYPADLRCRWYNWDGMYVDGGDVNDSKLLKEPLHNFPECHDAPGCHRQPNLGTSNIIDIERSGLRIETIN